MSHINRAIPDHPLVGSVHTFRPDVEPYDPDLDNEGGTLILGNGMPVRIKAVFHDWNGVPGLDMLYVYCMATGYHSHVTPADLSLLGLGDYVGPCPVDGCTLAVTRVQGLAPGGVCPVHGHPAAP